MAIDAGQIASALLAIEAFAVFIVARQAWLEFDPLSCIGDICSTADIAIIRDARLRAFDNHLREDLTNAQSNHLA